ncbi:hypothetical protein [Neobacillus citreus]|uniref:Uncharacterized protein n=1 Tax=Neobacillus citreus TaxID=2833578 RepID=A0A9J6MS93_9BACI|nr:hypothetical protein [Neobacillus citreus]MCH6267433.1 hypothetical protein [Neobacillus citreus]
MMDQEFTDETNSIKVMKLHEDIDILKQKIHSLEKEIENIQKHCRHIFSETYGMRKCRKCGFAESTYY